LIIRNNQKGFTIIELLVVIAILGILATLMIVRLNSISQGARDAKRIASLNQVSDALEKFKIKYGRYPAVDQVGTTDTFDEGWYRFGECLTKGEDCWSNIDGDTGAVIPGFVSDVNSIPMDPLNYTPTIFTDTYSPGNWNPTYWGPYSCKPTCANPNYDGTNYGYVIVAFLDLPHPELHGSKGTYMIYNDGSSDGMCDDSYVYCLKENWS